LPVRLEIEINQTGFPRLPVSTIQQPDEVTMILSELKAQAQQLGLTKEDVSKFGDLRKKSTWENAIAQFLLAQLGAKGSASMLEPASEVTGVLEIFIHEKSEKLSMDAEKRTITAQLEPPTEPETTTTEIVLTLFGPALKVCDEQGERHFLRGELVKLDKSQVCQVTGVFPSLNVEIRKAGGEVISVEPNRLRHLCQ